MSIRTTVKIVSNSPGLINLTQGTSITPDDYLVPDVTYTVTIPQTYTGRNPKTLLQPIPGGEPLEVIFTDSNYWQIEFDEPDIIWELVVVGTAAASSGSLNITFKDVDGTILLDKFQVIPGHLDTTYCANGDYSDSSIEIIFTKLAEFLYNETIFDSIRNTLAEFFANTAFTQGITEQIYLLNEEFK